MPEDKISIAAFGECMIEMTPSNGQHYRMGFAGDTLNVMLYLARSADLDHLSVDYVTALGDADPYSEMMLHAWQQEHIGTYHVRRLRDKMPGLYFIQNDQEGERHFYYYRDSSAAKEMFNGVPGEELLEKLLDYDYLYFSGISLAILNDDARQKLWRVLQKAREQKTIICFDTNYRSRLWPSLCIAKEVITEFLKCVDIALPSFDDERLLFGDASMQAIAKRLHQLGVSEVVVKKGGEGYLLSTPSGSKEVKVPLVHHVVDTTCAGDSFNGAYLANRMEGLSMEESGKRAANLAATVICYPGAIIPPEAMP